MSQISYDSLELDPRAPAVPIATEFDPEHVIVTSRGDLRAANHVTYTERDTERIRLGYCCIHCGESQITNPGGCPFPEACMVCGYRMRDRQRQRFALEFKGTVRLGPSTSNADELAIAEELLERDRREREGLLPSGIVVPRGISH